MVSDQCGKAKGQIIGSEVGNEVESLCSLNDGIGKPIQVMTLRDYLFENAKLTYQNNIFYQKDLPRNNSFEEVYLKLRAKENRVHSDDTVRNLPEINHDHPNRREWAMRKKTLKILYSSLSTGSKTNILELGCGNGWLSYNLARSLNANLCAVDVNEKELLQGARVFSDQKNLCFAYANIFDAIFQPNKFDAIILGSSIQYFKNLKELFATLFDLIKSSGTIYIADSPFYATPEKADAGKKRSRDYFDALGFPEMASQYFHHTFNDLKTFNYQIVYHPRSITAVIKRKILQIPLSVFPVIAVKK